MTTIAVAGATGYAGTEILRLILGHPAYQSGQLSIHALTGSSSVGDRLGQHAPHLVPLADREILATTAENLQGADVVFLALPHGHSGPLAEALGPDTLVIDCAADFRLRSASEWEHYYGSKHAGTWPYGLPEIPGARQQLATTRRVAVPGCFPTGATLALLPAAHSGLISGRVTVTSFTGVSGAGKKAAVQFLGAETMGDAVAYNVAGRHRHTPEITQNLQGVHPDGQEFAITFTPVLAPMARGILTTAQAALPAGTTAEMVQATYEQFYADEPFVHVLPAGIQPHVKNVVGTNMCHLAVAVDERTSTLVVTSAIDNLTKGTAGGAVQSMNIALGWEETAGLPTIAAAP
ncbi:N-acetyl-gamma-glutamyl-phosphate reductase [Corynebacterium aquilae]|uniref:N-acetyl-gamma-glutamyl-phosphate reductase n=1 Tax=Corynebacterium aquilae DSM 44791 TaxID=1431546 RepID=A0A1L7CFR0_9CORY|nr:N-acetyl-gamma-glutamyl-phosphate reductase [Corynebacterium aquilae]APT84679.1 N-acetyl-gamma-glutamyl-phosphate reductase [Corynebacterium aquilae DSM 44791]